MAREVELLHVAPAPPRLRERGMLGWLRVRIDGLVVDGISLREGLDGTRRLSFPVRSDAEGRRHAVVLPVDEQTCLAIERVVLDAVASEGGPR